MRLTERLNFDRHAFVLHAIFMPTWDPCKMQQDSFHVDIYLFIYESADRPA